MRKIFLLINLLLFVICNSNNATKTSDMISKSIVSEKIEETSNILLSSGKNLYFQDSILGCWGTHPETGNSILCFTSYDSVFWVDSSIWCRYRIEHDTIIMETDGIVYFQGQIKIQDDHLVLSAFDFIWRYERHEN